MKSGHANRKTQSHHLRYLRRGNLVTASKASQVDVETQKEMREKLEKGVMGVEEMRKWLEEKGIKLSYRGTHYWMGKLGRS